MASAEVKTGSRTSFYLLEQIEERQFEDIRQYRLLQLALLREMGEEPSLKDIDFILKEDADYEPPQEELLIDDEDWKKESLYRLSEKIVEEIENYSTVLSLLEPREGETDSGEYQKTDEEGNTRFEAKYGTVKKNLEFIKNGFSKLPEETELDYAEPFEELDRYNLF